MRCALMNYFMKIFIFLIIYIIYTDQFSIGFVEDLEGEIELFIGSIVIVVAQICPRIDADELATDLILKQLIDPQ